MRRKAIVTHLFLMAAWVALVLAQTAGTRVMVDVPFRFHVGKQTFAPGLYSFASEKDILLVAEGHGPAKARMLTNSFLGTSPARTGQVVFKCYSQECFLFQVWFPNRDRGAQMLTSPSETEFQKHMNSGVYMTLLGKEAK